MDSEPDQEASSSVAAQLSIIKGRLKNLIVIQYAVSSMMLAPESFAMLTVHWSMKNL